MCNSRIIYRAVAALVLVCCATTLGWAATFEGLNDLSTGPFFSAAAAVSDYGRVVVGSSAVAGDRFGTGANKFALEGYRWTKDTGMVGINFLTQDVRYKSSQAHATNEDGSIIVGGADILIGEPGNGAVIPQAFKWTETAKITALPNHAGDEPESTALAISPNGKYIGGYTADFPIPPQATYWETDGGGPVTLENLPNYRSTRILAAANEVSAENQPNQTFFVGESASGPGGSRQATQWLDNHATGLGYLQGATSGQSSATDITDARLVVGGSTSGPGSRLQAYRENANHQLEPLDFLPGFTAESKALAVSAKGEAIVGYSSSGNAERAFYWTQAAGMRDMKQVLTEHGLDLTGWTLTAATDVSSSGLTVVGNGINPAGNPEAWIAQLPQVVGLAWGVDVPRAYRNLRGRIKHFLTESRPGTTPAAVVTEETRVAIRDSVSQIFAASGVENISIVDGEVAGALNVYFADLFLGHSLAHFTGEAFSGLDQFNLLGTGGTVVFLQNDLAEDVPITAHEIGHALGLRHINPGFGSDPFNAEVMDYESPTIAFDLFVNAVSQITEPPKENGARFTDLTQNPVYHLKRYVDGMSHDQLVAQGIMPGTWDLNSFDDLRGSPFYVLQLDFGGFDLPLYDLHVLVGNDDPVEGVYTALLEGPATMLSDVVGQLWSIQEGQDFQLLAASVPGGELDIVLAIGNPFEQTGVKVFSNHNPVLLQLITDSEGGLYETLAAGSLTAPVPEPSSFALAAIGLIGLTLIRRQRRSLESRSCCS